MPIPRWKLARLALVATLAGCSDPDGAIEKEPVEPRSSIVGLYERAGIPDEPSRLCISRREDGLRFGLKSSWEGPQNCMMKGRVRQEGPALVLLIDGAPDCSLTARVEQGGLSLGEPKGSECGYYCGANTDLGEGAFTWAGSRTTDIAKAVDLVGEPLC